MFFKNLKVYRLVGWALDGQTLSERLGAYAYQEQNESADPSCGWVSPCEHASHDLVHAIDGQYLLTLRLEKKLLPAAVVRKHVKAKAEQIESQQGYKPGRKQMKDIKEEVTLALLPKAFTVPSDVNLWIDSKNGWLVIDTSSTTRADEVLGMLAKAIDPFPATMLHTEQSPASAMTSWLIDDAAPESLTIDQETEMRSASESRATVKYVHQSMEPTDVARHVQEGKQVARLAMTWNDKISFVMSDTMDLKKISPLDVLKEKSSDLDPHSQFDSEFSMMTGELSLLLADVVEGLGGERVQA